MSAFSSVGGASDPCIPSIIPAPATAAEPAIVNDGWFPDVDPNAFRRQNRIDGKVTPERLREAILGAIITVGNDLDVWRTANEAGGALNLAAVESVQIGGESRLMLLYRRAIACFTKAELVDRNRDIDTTLAGQARADELGPTADDLRRDGRHAVRDILGRSRTTVDLI